MENKKLVYKFILVDVVDFKVCFVFLYSLGVAFFRGYGKYFFRGNVIIEEGKALFRFVLFFSVGRKFGVN